MKTHELRSEMEPVAHQCKNVPSLKRKQPMILNPVFSGRESLVFFGRANLIVYLSDVYSDCEKVLE